jgi:ribosomal protein L11 methyltransferase
VIRLAVRCRPELAEAVLAELLVLAPGGVEESSGEGWIEYAVYGAPGELPELGDIKASAGDELIDVRSTDVAGDWDRRWTEFHKPVLVAERIWIRPPWEPPARDGLIDLVVDPGQAFGTGAHPTTRLCLELLAEERGSAGEGALGPLADWGTGSAVLAIAAAKLGWSPVSAVDHDQASIDAAAENAAANGVQLQLAKVNLRDEAPPAAPIATANLMSPLLKEIAARLAAGAPAPGTLICSGIFIAELDSVARAFGAAGLEERDRRTEGDWGALLLSAAA